MGIPNELTRRQCECVVLVAKSYPIKAVAAVLGISRKCVEYHLRQLDRTLGGHDVALITRYAILAGLILPKLHY